LRYVYQNGKTVRGPLTAVKFVPNPKRTDYRLSVVVSKKVHKSAVKRNRIRRRIYEAVRILSVSNSFDIVITVFHYQVATMPAEELQRLIHAQFKQAGLLL
jgi:ribonuclease P protein component